jgi:hypothetical protein
MDSCDSDPEPVTRAVSNAKIKTSFSIKGLAE